MENDTLPAYPRSYEAMGAEEWSCNAGFTKLEMASLMIAQGYLANIRMPPGTTEAQAVKKFVEIARVVLKEANKPV